MKAIKKRYYCWFFDGLGYCSVYSTGKARYRTFKLTSIDQVIRMMSMLVFKGYYIYRGILWDTVVFHPNND